jgi:3-oxoacyl-[acyl-carrier protein] reductase
MDIVEVSEMDLGLKGKNVIVTGGSMGIGTAISLEFGRNGANVALTYRRHGKEAEDIAKEIQGMGSKAMAVKADVSSYDDAMNLVDKVVKEWGTVDVMVCNAGINWDGPIWKMSEKQWDTVINVNLKGYFNYNKAAALAMKEQKYGKILNVSSINGLRGKFAQVNYSASKGGEIAMTKALAKELGRFNINVNVVAPGMVMTDMARNIPTEFLNKAIDETMVGRIATPEDVANVVVFMCSDKSRHITGEIVKIDGGQYI